AQKKLAIAASAVEVAREAVEEKSALTDQAQATMQFREKRWNRFKGLAGTQAGTEAVVEKEEKDDLAAKAAYEGGKAAKKKAQADWAESKANFEAAIADVKLKEAMVDVARKDRDRVQALADYAKITAPFDGVITNRDIDPGSFVSAAGPSSQPL